MNNRYRDFDRFLAEKNKTPITFKLYDRVWELPAELPVSVILQAEIVAKTQDLPEVLKLLKAMLGNQLDELLEAGLPVAVINELLTWLMELYTGSVEKETQNVENVENVGK